MTVSAAEALTGQLESYGVEYVFGTCGHTNIALLDALSRSRIRFVIARHEQTAAHAADGYARASGKPGVLLLHVGPGMMNAVTGVATAALDSVPLVAISGDVPGYYAGRHPHQEVNLHEDADQTAIYRPFSKRTWHVHRAEDLLAVHRARVLDGDHRQAGRGAAQRADGHLLPAAARRVGQPVPAARAGRRRPPSIPDLATAIAELLIAARAPAHLHRRRPAHHLRRARRCSRSPSTWTSRSRTR